MARTPLVAQPSAPSGLSRRSLLAGSLVGAAAITGCTLSNPTVNGPAPGPVAPSRSPSPSPSLKSTPPAPADSSFTKAAAAEQQAANLATVIGKRKGLSQDQRTLLALVAAAHTEHARALAGPEPTRRPTEPRPISAAQISTSGQDLQPALKTLAAAEARLARDHRRAAVDAKGLTALLWGSMAVAAETFTAVAAADPPSAAALRKHKPMELVSDVEAVQALVAQLHAIVYGYQLAIGKFPLVSKIRVRALQGLLQHRVLRDRLMAWLTSREAQVPTAAAAYVPSVSPTNAGSASQLIRQMETALQPFCGLWLAAAGTAADRSLALANLRSVTRTADSWGAGVRGWPGWSD